MISIVNYLYEFRGITDDMAFEAAKRLAKHRSAAPYDVDNSLYNVEQAGKKAATRVVDPSALADEDIVGIHSGNGPKSIGGKKAYKLLKKRFSQ